MHSSNIAGSQKSGGKKRINGPPPQPTLPAVRHAIVDLIMRSSPRRCPYCRTWILSLFASGRVGAEIKIGRACRCDRSLRPLLMLGEDIAFLGRGEAALRRQTG